MALGCKTKDGSRFAEKYGRYNSVTPLVGADLTKLIQFPLI